MHLQIEFSPEVHHQKKALKKKKPYSQNSNCMVMKSQGTTVGVKALVAQEDLNDPDQPQASSYLRSALALFLTFTELCCW